MEGFFPYKGECTCEPMCDLAERTWFEFLATKGTTYTATSSRLGEVTMLMMSRLRQAGVLFSGVYEDVAGYGGESNGKEHG